MRYRVLIGSGSKGRIGDFVRRYWHKGEKAWWLQLRLDSRTVCEGPEDDFQEIVDDDEDNE